MDEIHKGETLNETYSDENTDEIDEIDEIDKIELKIIRELRRITERSDLPTKILRRERIAPQFRCNIGALRLENPTKILEEWNLPEIKLSYNQPRRSLIFKYDETQILLFTLRNILKHSTNPELLPWGHLKIKPDAPKILIESSSPNIAKPFHMGHLRSTILGHFLSNLYEALGFKVITMNYLGDWGKQYGQLALAWERWGNEELLMQDPIRHLYDLYVHINKEITAEQDWDPHAPSSIDDAAKHYFTEMEKGNQNKLALWQRFRDLSLKSLEQTYNRLGIRYDVYSGESRAANDPECDEVIYALNRAGVLDVESDGVSSGTSLVTVQFERSPEQRDRNIQPAQLKKSDGSSLYLTRDLGEIFWRQFTHQCQKYIYVVGEGQALHFRQFFATIRILDPPLANRCQHVGFGLVKGMATRKGEAVFLNDVLDEAKARMLKKMQTNPEKYQNVANPEETADLLGQSAVIIQDLAGTRHRNYEFDWDRSCAARGLTGPYLQYAHARICNIFKKVQLPLDSPPPNSKQMLENEDQIQDLWQTQEWHPLVRVLSRYPNTLKSCLKSHEASPLVDLLMRIGKEISEAYRDLEVKTLLETETPETQVLGYRNALLFWSARQILASGMELLGLRPIEAM